MHETVCRSLLLIIISIIIKCIYIAQDREKLQMRWVTVTMQQECLKSVSERRQRGVKVLPLLNVNCPLTVTGRFAPLTFRHLDVSPLTVDVSPPTAFPCVCFFHIGHVARVNKVDGLMYFL